MAKRSHLDSCASFCAETNPDSTGPCDTPHACWCADGGQSYAEWAARHPARVKWAAWQERRELRSVGVIEREH
jgi:hypothetical protein